MNYIKLCSALLLFVLVLASACNPKLNETSVTTTASSILKLENYQLSGATVLAFGPENVITAAAHGHQAAVSIHLYLEGLDLEKDRPAPTTNLYRQKMGIHEWMYDSPVVNDARYKVTHEDKKVTLKTIRY